MSASLPQPATERDELGLGERIRSLIGTAHAQWSALAERRRMRAFGFRPAVEQGVLKREWQDMRVRVSILELRAAVDGIGDLAYRAADHSLTVDGRPFSTEGPELGIAERLLELIQEYERWVEAREGRAERIRRGRTVARDPRPVNALAETRRLRQVLNQARRA
jgi:hypothetical protein